MRPSGLLAGQGKMEDSMQDDTENIDNIDDSGYMGSIASAEGDEYADAADDVAIEDMEDMDGIEDNEGIDEEDAPSEGEDDAASGGGANAEGGGEGLDVYCLKLPYSHESVFASSRVPLDTGAVVIVPTRYGPDAAVVRGLMPHKETLRKSEIVRVEYVASQADKERIASLRAREKDAYTVFKEKAAARSLNLKAILVHFMFDGQKALFFFSAETRIDFRELVRDLVGQFRMRIELRQVGSRDEARMMGALGSCGRPLCCNTVTDRMRPVSIRMAKEQSLSLNSSKISGQCGRLLCCLAYEADWYAQARRGMPPDGVRVSYDGTVFRVTEANPISNMVRMLGEDGRVIEVNAKRFRREDSGRWGIQ